MRPLLALYDFAFTWRDKLGWTRALLLAISFLLTIAGIAFVHSTRCVEGEAFPCRLAVNQLGKAGIGILAMVLVLSLDYRLIERLAYLVFAFLLGVLGTLLVVKKLSGGEAVMRWIQIGFLNIQPSEFMKIALILVLARYLKFRSDMRSVAGLVVPFALTLAPFFLVAAQPNLGTALMLPPILFAALFLGGARRSYLAAAVLAGFLIFPSALLVEKFLHVPAPFMKPYQMKRLTAFLDRDEKTFRGEGYQLQASLIAFRSGGPAGRGYLNGLHSKYDFLPENHTDFIFAVIGEELGFAGASATVLALFLIVILCLRVALHTREPFGRLVSVAAATAFASQALENFGMTLGLTPITGVPLPFVSFGGSSLVTSYIALGLVLNIAFRRIRVVASQDLNPPKDEKIILVIDEHPAGAQRFPAR